MKWKVPVAAAVIVDLVVASVLTVQGAIIALLGEADSVSNAAPWAGWATSGLAGLILAWLFFKHLPDKDRQISSMLDKQSKAVEDKDKQIERMLSAKNEQIRMLTESGTAQIRTMLDSTASTARMMHHENQRALDRIIKHCEDEMKVSNEARKIVEEATQKDLERLATSVDELTTVIRDLQLHGIQGRTARSKWQPPPSGRSEGG